MSRAILKPKMTGPPWLYACWMILRRNQFERVSSLTTTNASSVAPCCELFEEHEMTCAISKIPDATAAIEGMSKVSFHLCRYSSYSNFRNRLLEKNIQIPRFHRYKCKWSTKPISTHLKDRLSLSRSRHGCPWLGWVLLRSPCCKARSPPGLNPVTWLSQHKAKYFTPESSCFQLSQKQYLFC